MNISEFERIKTNEKIDTDNIQTAVVNALLEKGLHIATAESCTGGMISQKITQVSGASSVFDCSVCSYSNEIKTALLGVKRETLIKYGAVSRQTAEQMARGILRLSKADIALSVTGIAGPTGGTAKKPVGLVYIGIATKDICFAIKCMFNDKAPLPNREQIREYSAKTALYYALKMTEKM